MPKRPLAHWMEFAKLDTLQATVEVSEASDMVSSSYCFGQKLSHYTNTGFHCAR